MIAQSVLTQRSALFLILAITAITGIWLFHSGLEFQPPNFLHPQTTGLPTTSPITNQPSTPPPTTPPYGAVIASGTRNSNLTFLQTLEPNWTTYPYNVDLEGPILQPDPRLRIPINKGNEAMTYLSWIIDNYDNLPWCAIFTHGHENSWHQDAPIPDLVRQLRLPALQRAGFINLRCEWHPTCPSELWPNQYTLSTASNDIFRKENELAISALWTTLFPGEAMPEQIASPCCAQFAVTRSTILRRGKGDYERFRNVLVETRMQSIVSGRVFEKLWAWIFTGEGVRCPEERGCRCEFFGRCEGGGG